MLVKCSEINKIKFNKECQRLLLGGRSQMQRCKVENSWLGYSGTGGKALGPTVSHELRMSQLYNGAEKKFTPAMTLLPRKLNKCISGEYKANYSALLSTNY